MAGVTEKELAAITDEGLFERLAMAVLRESDSIYSSVVHTGVNIAGKPIKAPVDGVCFVKGAEPPHLIAFHHTTSKQSDLKNKWLHNPATVKPRKGTHPTAPPGDLIKTADIVAKEREKTRNLRATLVLTTNEEPSESLVRSVESAGRDNGLEIDIWSRSRLAHFLDNNPTGQWIRKKYLNIEQELLSLELLYDLSKKSLEINQPPDRSDAWIARVLDETAKNATLRRDISFIVGGSGLGKSVACYRLLTEHVKQNGVGLIIPHEIISSAINLEQAIIAALCQLHANLSTIGLSPLSFCSSQNPLLLVVDDINRSGQAQLLAEKLLRWFAGNSEQKGLSRYRIVCPLWPEVLLSLGDQARKLIEPWSDVA